MIRLCFLIRQLNLGGAQRQLLTLAAGLDCQQFEITLLTFYSGGLLRAQLDDLAQVKYLSLNKERRWELLSFMLRLGRALRHARPQILHSYLGVSNVLAVLLKPFLRHVRIVWGVRASNMDWSRYPWHERIVFQLQRWLARWADLIIINSNAGFDFLRSEGFPTKKIVVIPNGIDTHRFAPNAAARQRVRNEWRVREHEFLIGLVARLDPMKDHSTFLRAAALLANENEFVRFICIGAGADADLRALQMLTRTLQLHDRVQWSAGREDMPAAYNALDLLTSTSLFGEGFSNVIGEAMACGVPCVVTNVGDSAEIVGATGAVIAPNEARALAAAWQALINESSEQRRARGAQARQRIVKHFSTEALAQKTALALKKLLTDA